jgi:hypothetical protein
METEISLSGQCFESYLRMKEITDEKGIHFWSIC